MSYLLTHLHTGWDLDQAIMWEKERLVVIRFGHDSDEVCMKMDQQLAGISELVKRFAVIYVVDITEVPYYNQIYELTDRCSVMFFFRNKEMQCDFGTGNNTKLNFLVRTKQELIDIIEVVYRAANKGVGIAQSPINYSNCRSDVN